MDISKATDQLIDAIRADVLKEVVDHLTRWQATLDGHDEDYLDGVGDAIITVEELLPAED